MKRMVWLLLLAFLAVPAAAFAQTDELLVSFEGFDYEFPDAHPADFGGAGDWYNVVGYVQSGHPLLGLDFSNNEYTIQFFNLWSTGFTDFGNFRFVQYTTGRVRVFEDPLSGGTHGDFNGSAFPDNNTAGAPPPNDTSPSTFNDGTLILGGSVTAFAITFDLTAGTGNFGGDVHFDEGTKLANVPVDVTHAYTFAGLTSEPSTVYTGYDHQVSGEIRIERQVKTETTSWGKMKALYR
ncbi:MAG TPA: hypothetical protein VGP93_17020 [Polyangiaceae bacterium]|jgi:hypothetical protein|nr:hypothetical protein [Polyangiaceae bacterium]